MPFADRPLTLIAGIWALMLFVLTTANAQWSPDREGREYGIGIATTTSPYSVPLFFNREPSASSSKVAYYHNDTLAFFRTRDTVRSFDQMVELAYGEIGFPILQYTPDSQWVKVTLDCRNIKNPPVGWLQRNNKDLIVRSWTEVLGKADEFFFIKEEWRSFYSKPSVRALIRPKLYQRNSVASYNMHRRQIKGRWMQVDLETPTSFCRSEAEVLQDFGVPPKKWTVWIQFLDGRLRPRIFYPTRGC